MLPSSQRLRTREVAEVLKHGRGLPSGAYLSAKVFYPTEGSSVTIRSAAVVSKKVATTAVARNRIRRALYDAVRAASRERRAASQPAAHVIFFVRSIPRDTMRSAFTSDIDYIYSKLAARR